MLTATRLLMSPAVARTVPASMDIALAYDLDSREVELDIGGTSTAAYLTEEQPTDRRPPASRAILLLPGADGVACTRTRRLADRLAVFCLAVVCVPDIARGQGRAAIEPRSMSWASSLPPRRVEGDVRAWSIYLRADHRASSVAIAGIGDAAPLVLRAIAADGPALGVCAGVAACAPRVARDEYVALRVPVLTLFDRGVDDDALAEAARHHLAASESTPAAALNGLTVDVAADGSATSVQPPPLSQPPPAARAPSISRLRALRVAELRHRLQALGLDTSGLKAELVARLHDALTLATSAPPAPPMPPPPPRRSPPPAAPMNAPAVMQFPGLKRAFKALATTGEVPTGIATVETTSGALEEMEVKAEARHDAVDHAGELEEQASETHGEAASSEDTGEDGLFMLEAWLNLHLSREEAEARTAKGRS